MYKTSNKTDENFEKITVDIDGLQFMLSCGKNTAALIGEKAGAVVRFGKRKLYIVQKIKDYLNEFESGAIIEV